MHRIKILNKKEIKAILKIIKRQWDADVRLDYAFLMNKKNRVYIVNRDVFGVGQERLKIDSIGLYFGTLMGNEFRLSIEGSQMIGPLAGRNVVDIDDREAESWLKGDDISTDKALHDYVIIRHGKDFLGSGKIKDGMIKNHYPKSRRISMVS